jgi:undecaprenyl-diphosphatase
MSAFSFARGRAFVDRHLWSLSLVSVSTFCFVRLAWEMREGEMDTLDRGVEAVVDAWRGAFDLPMIALTTFGDVGGMTSLGVVIAGTLLAAKRRRELAYFVVCSGGGLLINLILKTAFHRARPPIELAYRIPQPPSFSFPSGHSMGSAAVLSSAVVVLWALGFSRPIRFGAAFLALFAWAGVAVSRVYFGAHFPSDVVGGALAATAWVSAVTGWMYPRALPHEHAEHPLPPV